LRRSAARAATQPRPGASLEITQNGGFAADYACLFLTTTHTPSLNPFVMNLQEVRKAGRGTRHALAGAALLGLLTFTGAAAQSHAYAHRFDKPVPTEIYKPHSMRVAVYQVENTAKFKVHFENYDDSPVVLRIRAANRKVLHEEVVREGKYVRKFDLGNMNDGDYTFEIANGKENFSKAIQLQTLSARTLQIDQ
jgi:hypothetical protein